MNSNFLLMVIILLSDPMTTLWTFTLYHSDTRKLDNALATPASSLTWIGQRTASTYRQTVEQLRDYSSRYQVRALLMSNTTNKW